MKGKGCCKKWQQADLDHGVVQDRCLNAASGSIAILELTTHSAVTSCDGHTSSECSAGLHNDRRPNPS